MKLRVGLIGLGQAWELRHRPALRALSDRFEVRAVCEEVALRARQAATEFDADAVDGFRAVADRSDIDAVLMLSPQWFGALPILAACDAGKAIYCAHTLDLEADQARMIKQRVEESGIAFMAEFPRRQSPATLRLKELIATHLGPPTLLFCHQRLGIADGNNGQQRGAWQTLPITRELIEMVDWCRYVVGTEPSSVVGVTHQPNSRRESEDYRMLNLDFSAPDRAGSGAIAQVSCGRYVPAAWKEAVSFRPPAGMQVCCENGIAFLDLPSTVIWFDEAGRHQESLDRERPVGEHLLLQFHRAVTSLVRRTDDLEDAYRALTIVMLARESATVGRRMPLCF